MNILIVAKSYHSKFEARSIQMRRIVDALIEYTNHSITLITEGRSEIIEESRNLEIINIKPNPPKFPFFEKIFDRLVCSLFCIHKNKFMIDGVSVAEKVLESKKIDLLITVSTPFDSHLIGLKIKNRFNKLHWVSFFSDMWPSCLVPEPHFRNKILSKLEIGLMKNVVEQCDGILTPSKYTLDLIGQYFNTKVKLGIVPHCLNNESRKIENQMSGYIVHSGSLQKERMREALVEAVTELGAETKEFKGLVHIGAYNSKLEHFIKKHHCNNITLLGYIPEELARKIQSLFETGIIIEAPMGPFSPFSPSKITDSIQLNKKLVAITPSKGFLTDFADQHEGVYCCTYEKDDIKKSILKALISSEVISDNAINYFHPANVVKMYNIFFQSL